MSEFDTLLAKFTEKGQAKVHGAIFKCVDKHGKEIYSKIAGYDSVEDSAEPLREDCVLKLASASKLITSVALLQCIDQGLIGLDEPLSKILPELDGKEILKGESGAELISEPSKNKLTVRQLLSHTSGLAYRFSGPLHLKWAKTPEGQQHKDSRLVPERYNVPLAFEPGTGWLYAGSLEWGGAVVRRLHGGMSLEDYMIENIWKKIGLTAPFPTFHISRDPAYKARLMKAAERAPDGSLQPFEFWQGDNPVDQEGGLGLVCTTKDFLGVLGDLVSVSPRLLKPETIDLMFQPQLEPGSQAMSMLLQLRPALVAVAGPITDDAVNHGLGGLLLTGEVPEIAQPKGLLAWGGASNPIWFMSRELGVAGFFGTQISPFGDPAVQELVNAWKKEFWTGLNATS